MRRNTAGDTLLDVLAPLLLTGIALAGWSSTYDGNRWLLVGLGGAGVAGLLAVVAGAARVGPRRRCSCC